MRRGAAAPCSRANTYAICTFEKSYRDELDQTRHKISAAVELRGKGWSVNEDSIYSKDDVILLALVNGSFKSAALMKIVAEKAVVT